jgi:hypothetical protein
MASAASIARLHTPERKLDKLSNSQADDDRAKLSNLNNSLTVVPTLSPGRFKIGRRETQTYSLMQPEILALVSAGEPTNHHAAFRQMAALERVRALASRRARRAAGAGDWPVPSSAIQL